MRPALLSPILMLAASLAVPSPAAADRLDDYVREQMERQHIPGLSIAVAKAGKPPKLRSYGLANLEQRTPVQPETPFQIQSMTKSFTATGIMLLVEEGKLRLEDPISRFFESTPEAWREITVRHLLNHTSGIKDFINEPVASLRLDVTEEEVLRITLPRPLNFRPGERYAYSNTGYHLLGMILRKLTGLHYGEFLRRRIFEPLEMEDTRVVHLSRVIPARAHGYSWNGVAVRNGEYVAGSILGYAGGGLLSTPTDLLKWFRALGEGRLLSRASLEQMWTHGKLNSGELTGYGLGWGIGEEKGRRFVTHSGAHMTGFTSAMVHFPDDRLTVVVLSNQRAADPTRIALGLARRSLPSLMPPRRNAAAVSDAELRKAAGRYEVANNSMLTLVRGDRGLYAANPSGSGEWLIPAGEGKFFGAESDHEYTIVSDPSGEVRELVLKQPQREIRAPRIGPLVADLRPSNPDPLSRRRVRKVLSLLGPGGEAVAQSPDMSAGARQQYSFGMPALVGLREVEFLGEEDVSGRGLVRHGGQVARLLYARLALEEGPVYALVHLTPEGLFTDLDLVEQ